MKRWALIVVLAGCGDLEEPTTAHVCGPGPGGDTIATAALPEGLLLTLGVAADFSSSAVDALPLSNPSALDPNRIVATGDAVLRKLGDQAVVINRGAASNLQLIDGGTFRGQEVSLDVCNPHDVEMANDCTAIATCYDGVRLKLIDLAQGTISDGPDLSAFIDTDGLPEQDQLIRVGDKIYVSLQRLDRGAFYTPVGNAKLAVIDAATLTLEDDIGIELPCQNPYTDLSLMPDGRLAVACVGDFVTMSQQRVVTYDPSTGETAILTDGDTFAGSPSGMRAGPNGEVFLLNTVPDAFNAEAMQLVRVDDDGAHVLYEREGYSLAGLAVTAEGDVYVGDRSFSDAGIYRFLAGSSDAFGPIATSLPPYELEAF